MARTDERPHRLSPVRRHGERVTPLELFFDLIFVLAITQCTAVMSTDPTWSSMGEAMLLLAILWWAWVGYAWLTSVVDPEEGAARLLFLVAAAAMLIAALALPDAIGDEALTFAVSYAVVRGSHIALFVLTSREDPTLRRSVVGHGTSTAICSATIILGATLPTNWQVVVWSLALLADLAEPYFFGIGGWELVPGHFAERHGLIVLVALGESIVALGVGTEAGLDGGEVVAAVLGIALAGAMWWAYFDHVAAVSVHVLEEAPPGVVQNAMARDGYSYLHFLLVAGIVLSAFGVHEALAHVDEPLDRVPAVALAGGTALHLLGHVAFRYRCFRTVKWTRLLGAAAAALLIVPASELDAGTELALVAAVLWAVVAYESIRYREERARVRHRVAT